MQIPLNKNKVTSLLHGIYVTEMLQYAKPVHKIKLIIILAMQYKTPHIH